MLNPQAQIVTENTFVFEFVHKVLSSVNLDLVLMTPESGVWGSSKVHLTLFLQQSEGRDHASSPLLPEGAVCTNLGCAFLIVAQDQVLRPHPPWLTGQPHGCTAALTLGSLGSAAKVNNECIFLLHITSLVMMSTLLSGTFVFSSCVNNPGRYGRGVDVTSSWAAAV